MTEQSKQEQTEMEASSQEQLPEPQQTSEELGAIEEPDFAALTGFVEDDVEEETPPVAAEAEIPEETPAEETPPEEAAAPTEEESEETPEETEEPQAAAPEPEPEPVKLPTKEELTELYTEHRNSMLPKLEDAFKLSEEEANALDERPSEVLPKMAAQLQYDVMLSTYNAVMQAMPAVMGTLMRTNDLATQAHARFMEAWPKLNGPKAEPAVKAAVKAYRAANPRASLEDTIQNAGVMAMIQMGYDPLEKAAVAKPKPKAPPPPKPAAPTGTNPEPPMQQEQESNVFADIAEVFDQNNR